MASVVVYATEFDRYLDRGLAPERFRYRLLVEGDSWMERSSVTTPSLPDYLARAMDAAGDEVLIVNLARFGDTLRRIGECVAGDLGLWVNTDFGWKFDALLLSVGGNDFIDAARDPPPGQGILRDLRGQLPPVRAADCIDQAALDRLVYNYLDPNFATLMATLQASRHAGVPVLLNQYDTPTARDAPPFPGARSWLAEAFRANGVPETMWPGLAGAIFAELRQVFIDWADDHPQLTLVPTQGMLSPALAGSRGDSGDWINEIHPNPRGWIKLAAVWRECLLTRL